MLTRHQLLFLSAGVLLSFMVTSGCGKKGGAGKEREDPFKGENLIATEEAEPDLIDQDYCFRLSTPNRMWKLLDEAAIQGFNADAVAGATHVRGGMALIIVQPIGTATLDRFSEMIANMIRQTGFQIESEADTRLADQEARQFQGRGNIDGLPYRFESRMLVHQGYGYHMEVLGLDARFDEMERADIFNGFFLTEGEVRSRGRANPVHDYLGVGRRVVQARFESAVEAIAVDSGDGWDVAAGAELEEMDVNAEVGLVHMKESRYLTITGSPAKGSDRDVLLKEQLENLQDQLAGLGEYEQAEEPVTYQVADQQVQFHSFLVKQHLETRHLVGWHVENDRLYEIYAWWLEGLPGDAEVSLQQGLNKIEFLSEDQVQKLKQELLATDDPENTVGPNWSVRKGTFRNFEHSLLWRKPERQFWRLYVGDQLRSWGENAVLVAREPRLQLLLELYIQPQEDWTLTDFHNSWRMDYFVDPKPAETTTIAGLPALVTRGTYQLHREHQAYLATQLRNGQLISWFVEGPADQFAQAESSPEAILQTVDYPRLSWRPVTQTENSHRDERIGFQLDLPPDGWKIEEKTPPELSAAASAVHFFTRKQSVLVMGMTTLKPGQDESGVTKLMGQILGANFNQLANSSGEKSTTTFAGVTWKQELWNPGQDEMRILVATRDRTLWMLLLEDKVGTGEQLLKQTKRGFRFLD